MTGTLLDWLRLHLTRGLGRQGLFRLIAAFGSPAAALAASGAAWQRLLADGNRCSYPW